MSTYRFQIRKHVRDDMWKNESIELELSDSEIKNLTKSDDSKYSGVSSFLSSKLGGNVQALGFPVEVKSSSKKDKSSQSKTAPKTSLFKPLWAFPFKLIWRIIKFILRF